MRPPLLRLVVDGLVVDSFAGGGGASTGIERALGRSPDLAVNHDREALAMHRANHPRTRHLCEDVWDVDPREVCGGQPVALAWFSPDCTFHSKARGSKPFRDRRRALRRRGLAWVVTRWANDVRPRVICLENVEEFQDWGPLGDDDRPLPEKAGFTFRRWVARLQNLGYAVDWRELRAHDYGAPTIRKRLFVVARCDGLPIAWPTPTHGPDRPRPYRPAAECIDWSLPVPSIFGRKRPLAENTLRRIARGIRRFVLESADPFIVPLRGTGAGHTAAHGLDEPAPTATAQGSQGAVAAAFLARHFGGPRAPSGACLRSPVPTVTSVDHHSLVTAQLGLFGGVDHREDVRAFLLKFYGSEKDGQSLRLPLGTVTTKDRFGLVTVAGCDYEIVDIGMRMLAPRELFRAQGFDDDYAIEPVIDGKPLTKTAQVRMCGNSVAPDVAAALVAANLAVGAHARGAA